MTSNIITKSRLSSPEFFHTRVVPWDLVDDEGCSCYYDIKEIAMPVCKLDDVVFKLWLEQPGNLDVYQWIALKGALQIYLRQPLTVKYVGRIVIAFDINRTKSALLIVDNFLIQLESGKKQLIHIQPQGPVGIVVALHCDEVVVTPEERIETIAAQLTAKIDKSDPATYKDIETAAAFVKETYPARLSDMLSILACYGKERYVFVHDGAGPGHAACKVLRFPSKSYDPSDAMIQMAQALGNDVEKEGDVLKILENHSVKDVFVISHSETIDPGVVKKILDRGRQLIVYESVQGYEGYASLYECHPFVRSTKKIVMKIELSKKWKKVKRRYNWISLVQHRILAIDEVSCVEALSIYGDVFDESPTVYAATPQLRELVMAKGCKAVEGVPKDGVAIYYHQTAFWLDHYFNIQYGIYHFSPAPDHVLVGKNFMLFSVAYGPIRIRDSYYTMCVSGTYHVAIGKDIYAVRIPSMLSELSEGLYNVGRANVVMAAQYYDVSYPPINTLLTTSVYLQPYVARLQHTSKPGRVYKPVNEGLSTVMQLYGEKRLRQSELRSNVISAASLVTPTEINEILSGAMDRELHKEKINAEKGEVIKTVDDAHEKWSKAYAKTNILQHILGEVVESLVPGTSKKDTARMWKKKQVYRPKQQSVQSSTNKMDDIRVSVEKVTFGDDTVTHIDDGDRDPAASVITIEIPLEVHGPEDVMDDDVPPPMIENDQ